MNLNEEWRKKLQEEDFNPFLSDNVGDPWEEIQDAEGIHQEVDKKIINFCKHIKDDHEHKSMTVLIHGFAGSGKSHLLSRIRKNLNDQAYFTFVQPMVSDNHHWQYLQRQIIGSLLRPYPLNRKYTQLHYLICRGVEKMLPPEDAPDADFFPNLAKNPINLICYLQSYPELPEKIINILDMHFSGQINKDFLRVLICFLDHKLQDTVKNWLRCMSLSDEECHELRISQTYAKEEFHDDTVRDLLTFLFLWSSYDRPIILCFDQLDHYSNPGGELKLRNYADIVSHIVNYTKNVLCLSSLLTGSIEEFKKIITNPSDQDRLVIHDAADDRRSSLQPVADKNSICQIIEARLATLHKKHSITDPLFPFTAGSAQEIIETLRQNQVEIYPRTIIRECAKEYDRRLQKDDALIATKLTEPIEDFLQKTYIGRRDFYIKENSQVIDENMEEEQLRRLLQCVVDHTDNKFIKEIRDFRKNRNNQKPWDFEFDTCSGKTYAVEVYENHSNTWYARHLQTMLAAWNIPAIQSLFWIRRKSNPIKLGKTGIDRMHDFMQRGGFDLTDWSENEWNSIQALIWMLNESSGGNLLYYDGHKDTDIKPEQIEKWIAVSKVLQEMPVIRTLLNQVNAGASVESEETTVPMETAENYLENAGKALKNIVKKHCLIELNKAYHLLLQQEAFAGLTKEDCLRSVEYAEGVACNTAQNFQILYLDTLPS